MAGHFDYTGIEITDQQGVKQDSVAATEAIPQLSANRTAPRYELRVLAGLELSEIADFDAR